MTMKLQNNWRNKTLENLEKEVWPNRDNSSRFHFHLQSRL